MAKKGKLPNFTKDLIKNALTMDKEQYAREYKGRIMSVAVPNDLQSFTWVSRQIQTAFLDGYEQGYIAGLKAAKHLPVSQPAKPMRGGFAEEL